jgi:enoyl-CoA hydratase/carnithine racemase
MAETYRTYLKDYAEKYKSFLKFRREDGILEARFHSADGEEPLKWALEVHHGIIHAMADINNDPENECLIVTGTGDSFLAEFDHDSWRSHGFYGKFGETHAYDVFYRDQTREPFAMLNLHMPVIAAVNGPSIIHAELVLLNDIVICTPNTHFYEGHWDGLGIVPGDGVHTLFRELLGPNRGRYFLLMGQRIEAEEALSLGLVGEVLPREKLLERAWEIAHKVFMTKNRVQRRLTRALLTQPWRELFLKELPSGMAHEALASLHYWPMSEDKDSDIAKLIKR